MDEVRCRPAPAIVRTGCIEANVAGLFSDLLARPAFASGAGTLPLNPHLRRANFPPSALFAGVSWSEWSTTARMIKKRSFQNHTSGRSIWARWWDVGQAMAHGVPIERVVATIKSKIDQYEHRVLRASEQSPEGDRGDCWRICYERSPKERPLAFLGISAASTSNARGSSSLS